MRETDHGVAFRHVALFVQSLGWPESNGNEGWKGSAGPQAHEKHLQHLHQDDLLGSSLKAAAGNGVGDVPQRRAWEG